MGKTLKQIRSEVESLSAANVDSDSRHVDWREAYGDDCEGWRSYEAVRCSECGRIVVLSETGEVQHCNVDDETRCAGYLNSEGPMMNYFYPADFRMSCEEAAKLCDGACIVVEMAGETGFALAGGGMDLSWDIAASYVNCGLLPPARIRLPEYAGLTLTPKRRKVIEACRESAEVMAQRARANVSDLERLIKRMRVNGKRRNRQAA